MSGSRAWWIVARTEYGEGVRTKWFLWSTILGPLLLGGLVVFSIALQLRGSGKPVHVAMVDESVPSLGATVRAALEEPSPMGLSRFVVETPAGDEARPEALAKRVESGAIDGWLTLPADVAESGHAAYVGSNASSTVDMARLAHKVEEAVVRARAQRLGLADGDVKKLLARVEVDARQAGAGGESASGAASFFVAYGAAISLYMAILLYGMAVMRAVIQEKTSRVMEVVVACTSPWDLMVGKVLGVGALGLTQLAIWIAAGGALASFRGPLAARFGVAGAGAIAVPLPSAGGIAVIAIYFALGYTLYSSLFAALGAANNSEREAQQAQMPVMMLLVGAFMCFPVITAAPRAGAAVALTLVPFFSPILMPMRFLLAPMPAWQLGASLALLAVTIVGTLWAASRIYRVGILMYGKKPTLGEIVRWIRET